MFSKQKIPVAIFGGRQGFLGIFLCTKGGSDLEGQNPQNHRVVVRLSGCQVVALVNFLPLERMCSMNTPPKTNMEPEMNPWKMRFFFEKHHFQVPC